MTHLFNLTETWKHLTIHLDSVTQKFRLMHLKTACIVEWQASAFVQLKPKYTNIIEEKQIICDRSLSRSNLIKMIYDTIQKKSSVYNTKMQFMNK